MATFTINLLTGEQYLFTGDFVQSGVTSMNWTAITNKPQWLSGATLVAFQTGHTHSYNNLTNRLSGGTGIIISNNIISTTAAITTLQLIDISGNTEINTIPVVPIIWTTIEFSGTSLSFTGGSKIYFLDSGTYALRYVLNFASQSGGTKNIGAVIRKNGNIYITPSTSNAFAIGSPSDIGTNTMPSYETALLGGDYIELVAYRIGDAGSALTIPNASWLAISKQV